MPNRLGTFEEWYASEMKARSSKRTWHYPTELCFDDRGRKVVYRTRETDQVRHNHAFIPIRNWDMRGGQS